MQLTFILSLLNYQELGHLNHYHVVVRKLLGCGAPFELACLPSRLTTHVATFVLTEGRPTDPSCATGCARGHS